MTNYVAGLLFSKDMQWVALVEKKKPAWQYGKLNAIGGKIEEGETPYDAMVREFEEETGVHFTGWYRCAVLDGPDWQVNFFYGASDLIWEVETVEEERILVGRLDDFVNNENLMPNLKVIIPIALDTSGIIKPVYMADGR